MSDTSEATAALTVVESLIEEAKAETDPTTRLGKILMVKEAAGQAVKFARRAFLASAGFDQNQTSLPLGDDGDKSRRGH